MKWIHYIIGILFSFCLVIMLLITSIEAVTYWTPGYYEKEYEKYHVLDSVHMEMAELLRVTEEMMAYLRGNREDLHVPAIVDGQSREFFNEREISHMEDVRNLFLGGLVLRRICIFTALACLILLAVLKAPVSQVLPASICLGTGLFFAVICGLAAIIASDFTKYFVIFHQIFFDNDLWILDPATDLLINIVPEPFFVILLQESPGPLVSASLSYFYYAAYGFTQKNAIVSRKNDFSSFTYFLKCPIL